MHYAAGLKTINILCDFYSGKIQSLKNTSPFANPHPRPNSSPHQIHHQIRHLEKTNSRKQLETLDAEGKAESGQSHKSYSAPGARQIQQCQELRQKEPERDKSGYDRDALDMPLSTFLEQAEEV